MSKKHYIKFAEFFKNQLIVVGMLNNEQAYNALEATINDFCELLADDNSRFNKNKFLQACGIEIE